MSLTTDDDDDDDHGNESFAENWWWQAPWSASSSERAERELVSLRNLGGEGGCNVVHLIRWMAGDAL